jgi:mannose-6-phosphate isomerase-like protein (cupin superfamily)
MSCEAINFGKKFKLFDEQWQPKVVAEMNDYQFKIVRLQGNFIWHDHKNTDETFIVLEGVLRIDFRDGAVRVAAGEMFVVPKGGRTRALCGTRGQALADRAARGPQHGP